VPDNPIVYKDVIYKWVKKLPDDAYLRTKLTIAAHSIADEKYFKLEDYIAIVKKDKFLNQLDIFFNVLRFAQGLNEAFSRDGNDVVWLDFIPVYKTDEVFKATVFDIDIIGRPVLTTQLEDCICALMQGLNVLDFLSDFTIEVYQTTNFFLLVIPNLPVETYLEKYYDEKQWIERMENLEKPLIQVNFVNGYHYRYHYVDKIPVEIPSLRMKYKRKKPTLLIKNLREFLNSASTDFCKGRLEEKVRILSSRALTIREGDTLSIIYDLTNDYSLYKLVDDLEVYSALLKLPLV